MIIAVTGGRDHVVTNKEHLRFHNLIEDLITNHRPLVMRHGDARGVDKWCAAFAYPGRIKVEPWPANWKRDGKYAGPRRNRAMLEGPPRVDLLIVFPGGRGTHHCLSVAIELEIQVQFV
jgi:hypothetical protein